MKKILLIILIFLFSFSINAEEIIMVCTHSEEGERILRYKETVGIKSVDIRREGGVWENWGSNSRGNITSKLQINDKGAILNWSYVSSLPLLIYSSQQNFYQTYLMKEQ